MGSSKKKKKQNQKVQYERQEKPKKEPPNEKILDSIGSPNVWTPEKEDAWHEELRGIPAGEIYRRFPPIKKPGNVGRRGKNNSWGEEDDA